LSIVAKNDYYRKFKNYGKSEKEVLVRSVRSQRVAEKDRGLLNSFGLQVLQLLRIQYEYFYREISSSNRLISQFQYTF